MHSGATRTCSNTSGARGSWPRMAVPAVPVSQPILPVPWPGTKACGSRLSGSRTDSTSINVLESAGVLITRAGSVGFTHQTVFEHLLARGFAGGEGRLTRYVLERQGSLFLRPKLWVGLSYLRGVAWDAYHQELESIWSQPELRDHLQLLLIDFLGSQSEPTDREVLLMEQALRRENHHRLQAFRSMSGSPGWFARFRSDLHRRGHARKRSVGRSRHGRACACMGVRPRRSGSAASGEAGCRTAVTISARGGCYRMLRTGPRPPSRLPAPSLGAASSTPILSITSVATVGVGQPEAALRLAHARLVRELDARKRGVRPTRRSSQAGLRQPWRMKSHWQIENSPSQSVRNPDRGDARLAPPAGFGGASDRSRFLEILWPWFEECFAALSAARQTRWEHLDYPLAMEVDFRFEQESESRRSESPLLAALRTAAECLAEIDSDEWLAWRIESVHSTQHRPSVSSHTSIHFS